MFTKSRYTSSRAQLHGLRYKTVFLVATQKLEELLVQEVVLAESMYGC